MLRWVLIAAAVSGMAAVMIGAAGAHAISNLPQQAQAWYDTAGIYHRFHAVALALAALAPAAGAHRHACAFASAAWLAGMLLFSGSLYLLAFTGAPWLGAITPFGGVALMGGWVALGVAALLARRS